MKKREIERLDGELRDYVGSMVGDLGRSERRAALGWYITGLLLDGERKSIGAMAGRLAPEAQQEAMRQRLQQAVSVASWNEEVVWCRLAQKIDAELPELEALVLDHTGMPKKGKHSVGVARQYCGTLGRVDNCQVVTSLHLAGERGSACIGMRLFLPEAWAQDLPRRRRVGVPDEVVFQKKWELALGLLDQALTFGVRRHVVLGDAEFGDATEFRQELDQRALRSVLGISGTHRVWPPWAELCPPCRAPGQAGKDPTWWTSEDEPVAIQDLALIVSEAAYERVYWRQGSQGRQSSRFVALRVRPAENWHKGKAQPPAAEVWLLCEWPRGEQEPTKFWLSTLPEDTPIKMLVRLAKLRWRVERDYQEMKQEVGLDHFEGRTWAGLHHHGALCALAHGFLALRRGLFPPQTAAVDSADGPSSTPGGRAPLDRQMPPLHAPLP